MTPFQIAIITTMVLTGALNTVSATLQLARPARNKYGELRYFEHYYVQTFFMLLGESLCLPAYLVLKWVVREHPERLEGEAKPVNPLVLWPAAFMDIVGTSLDYMGLAFMKNAGLFQMLRVTPLIWCGLLSIPLLRQRLKWFNWAGIIIICAGLCIKAIPLLLDPPQDQGEELQMVCREAQMNITSASRQSDPGQEEEEEASCGITCLTALGVAMVVVGEFFHGLQYVYEQKYMVKYDLHPLKVVGLEGVCGVLTLAVLLVPAYFITLDMTGVMEGIALGPDGRLEDAVDAVVMIFDGNQGHSGPDENNYWLLFWTLANMCSIAVFNWSGTTVAKELDATTRAVLDQLRIVLIWVIFLLPLGEFLCRVQDFFHWTAPIGLSILIVGVWIYNDVIILPFIRKCCLSSKSVKN